MDPNRDLSLKQALLHASQNLSSSERDYAQIKKDELLAIVFGTRNIYGAFHFSHQS